MSKNLVHSLAQKFNHRHVQNQTDTSVTTNIRTKQITKSSTSINSTSTTTNIKQFPSFNEELMQKFKKINNTSVATNIQNEMVAQTCSNSGNTTVKSVEKPVVPRKEFLQNGKTTNIVPIISNKTGNNFSIHKNNTTKEITKSSAKPAVPKREFSQKVKTFENPSVSANVQKKNVSKRTTEENMHSSISSNKPEVPNRHLSRSLKNIEEASATTNIQTKQTISSPKPVVPKKNVPQMIKRDEHLLQTQNKNSPTEVMQSSTVSSKPIVPKKDFPKTTVFNKQTMEKQIETVEIINIETSNQDNTLITSKIMQEMKEENKNIIPKDDNIEEIKESDTALKTIDEVQNQVENIQQMLEDWQNTCEETKEDIEEENKETIDDNHVGNITNNTSGYSHMSGRLRNAVQETSNEESRVFQMKSLEETQEIIRESTQATEDNHTDNIINNKAYLYMSGRLRSKVQEEISNEETKVFEENENLTETVDVFSNTVVGFKDMTTETIEKYTPVPLDNSEYVDEEIKESTSATYTDDGTYEPIDVTNGAITIINPHQDTEINKDAFKTISQIRFDDSKSSRDTFLSLQSKETITESIDAEEEEWLDLYASQENLASHTNENLEATKQNMPLMKILEKYDKNNISWRKIMEYMQLNIINTLTSEKIEAQEAKLYLIRKELMYLDALNILNNHFISKLVLFISQNEFKILFGNVKEVIECSQKLMKDLEDCWKNSVLMPNFANVLCKNLQTTFNIYVSYCESQTNFEKTLEHIISDRKRHFMEILDEIQKDPVCCGLHLHAYMLLPVQKIHRFPMLIENILQFLTPVDEEYHQFHNSLDHINHLLKKCTKAVKDREIWAKTMEFMNQLDFPKDVPLEQLGIHEKRQIIRSGEVDMLEFSNSLFGKKVIRKPVHLFLFNDLLVIARKNSKDRYSVLQYSLRIYVDIETDFAAMMPYYEFVDPEDSFLLKMDQSLPKEILIVCKTVADKIRWQNALDPEDSQMKNRYESDGYFQVIGERNYKPCQSDEISVHVNDVIHVYRNIENSWYFGKNTKTGDVGWFPTGYAFRIHGVLN